MICSDLTTSWPYRGARRRSEPVHIRDVVAQIRTALETRRREMLEDSRGQFTDVGCTAQSAG